MSGEIFTYHGDVETTSFFMTRIEEALSGFGYSVIPLYYDRQIPEQALEKAKDAVFLTFNFAGIYSKDALRMTPSPDSEMFVDHFGMKCINIMVDHPYHYHDFLYEQERLRSGRYFQFCIDKAHISYMKEYFPELSEPLFMPSAGTDYGEGRPDTGWDERPIDVLFAGTYVPPEGFSVFIDRNGPEYSRFYHSVLDEVLADPEKKLDEVLKRRFLEEDDEEVSFEDMRKVLGHIQFLDYYIRYKRRGETIIALADHEPPAGAAPLNITIAGSGWESLLESMAHPERITLLPYCDSEEVLRLLSQAKFSLNILPSFREGAHDRIFNSMLCGAVCVTDSNPYLDTMLRDGENALIFETPPVSGWSIDYNLKRKEDAGTKGYNTIYETASLLMEALKPGAGGKMREIADRGALFAKGHTWEKRTFMIKELIEKLQ